MNLLSILGLLNANGQDPNDPTRDPVAESPLAPGQNKPASGIDMGSPAANFMFGRAMAGDKDAAAAVAPALRQQQMFQLKQQQQALMVKGYAQATAGIPQLIKDRRYSEAAEAYRNASQFAMSDGQRKEIEDRAKYYEQQGEKITQAKAMRDAVRKGGPKDAAQGRALEIMEDDSLLERLALHPGGIEGAMKALAPTFNFEGGLTREIPSPMVGGEPKVIARETPDIKLTPEESKAASRFGVTDQMLSDLNRDPSTRHVAQGTLLAIRRQMDTATALNTYVKDPKVHDILAARPDANQIMKWATSGSPQDQAQLSQVITEARKQVESQDVEKMVREAWARATATAQAERAANANDLAPIPGKEVYDLRSRQVIEVTNAMKRNPAVWAANGGYLKPVDASESRQLTLQRTELEPTIPAANALADRLLARATAQNIARGAELATMRRLGGADIKLFDEQMRTLYIGLSRIESGSVRIPVTMFQALQGTGPTEFSSLTQAKQFLNAVAASLQNRENGYLGLPPVPIPTGNEPTVAITVKDGKIIKAINPTAEPDTDKAGRKPKLVK